MLEIHKSLSSTSTEVCLKFAVGAELDKNKVLFDGQGREDGLSVRTTIKHYQFSIFAPKKKSLTLNNLL